MRLIPAHAGKTSSLGSAAFRPRAHPRSRGENPLSSADLAWPSGSSPLTRGKRGAALRVPRHRGLIPAHAGKTGSRPRRPARSTAHPRSRGENRRGPPGKARTLGSSPLTRGKHRLGQSVDRVPGLIPAHAGKTWKPTRRRQSDSAHPRSRGENVETKDRGRLGDGSSPLTRGKHFLRGNRNGGERLIPAHAGKTRRPTPYRTAPEAHPRSRGENVEPLDRVAVHEGSSPLTRGKRGPLPRPLGRVRLIPAHAGKTCPCPASRSPSAAHPRSRGENARTDGNGHRRCGSSPLTRGKPSTLRRRASRSRLIPAHAGKTRNTRILGNKLGAHPRSRGENGPQRTPGERSGGSSPLTRGKQPLRAPRWRRRRLIPAHAGKTTASRLSYLTGTAHPRSRGENGKAYLNLAVHAGSSPLTRGKREGPGPLWGRGRLIPAHAGKTSRTGPPGLSGAAHPRSRGENSLDGLVVDLATGSSPLTRGKLTARSCTSFGTGLIPAHAGKTRHRRGSQVLAPAHPRSRGENNRATPGGEAIAGSSPLTRGKRASGANADARFGLIPAHAGKTAWRPARSSIDTAHPRSRGENLGRLEI